MTVDGEFTAEDVKFISPRASNILNKLCSNEEIALKRTTPKKHGGEMNVYEVVEINLTRVRKAKTFPCTKKIKGCKEFMPDWFGILG